MAVETIQTQLVTQFSAKVHADAQQIKSRLRPYVEIQQMNAEKMAYDGIGAVEAQEVAGRHMPVVFGDIIHKRRKIASKRFVVTLPIDSLDVDRSLLDPKSKYSEACVRAMERKFDRVVAEAAFASVYTGQDFETTVTAATDGVVTVDATVGLTYEKLLEIGENFMNNDVGTDVPEKIILAISGDEHTALMKEIELVSGDFSRQYAIDKGKLIEALGNTIVVFGADAPIPVLSLNSSSKRRNIAMSTRAICVGMTRDMQVMVEKRPDLINTSQVQITGVWGAVRTEGKLVQEFTTTPNA